MKHKAKYNGLLSNITGVAELALLPELVAVILNVCVWGEFVLFTVML
jgi:hypothetical protein